MPTISELTRAVSSKASTATPGTDPDASALALGLQPGVSLVGILGMTAPELGHLPGIGRGLVDETARLAESVTAVGRSASGALAGLQSQFEVCSPRWDIRDSLLSDSYAYEPLSAQTVSETFARRQAEQADAIDGAVRGALDALGPIAGMAAQCGVAVDSLLRDGLRQEASRWEQVIGGASNSLWATTQVAASAVRVPAGMADHLWGAGIADTISKELRNLDCRLFGPLRGAVADLVSSLLRPSPWLEQLLGDPRDRERQEVRYCAPYQRELIERGLRPLTEREMATAHMMGTWLAGEDPDARPSLLDVALVFGREDIAAALILERHSEDELATLLPPNSPFQPEDVPAESFVALTERIIPGLHRLVEEVPFVVLQEYLQHYTSAAYLWTCLRNDLTKTLAPRKKEVQPAVYYDQPPSDDSTESLVEGLSASYRAGAIVVASPHPRPPAVKGQAVSWALDAYVRRRDCTDLDRRIIGQLHEGVPAEARLLADFLDAPKSTVQDRLQRILDYCRRYLRHP